MKYHEVDEDQRHQEARDCHAQEGNGGEQVVDPGILPCGRPYAEGDAKYRCEDVADQRQSDSARQAFANHIGDRLVVIKAVAEIAAGEDAADPVEILNNERLIEPVFDAVCLRLRFCLLEGSSALVHQLRADVIGVVAGRRLDDGESHHAQDQQHRNGGCHAYRQKSQHRTVFLGLDWPCVAGRASRATGTGCAPGGVLQVFVLPDIMALRTFTGSFS